MDDGLLDIVLKRLAESPLAEQATNLLLAALDGEESLSAQLGGQAGQRPAGDLAGAASPRPAAAFLRSLTVSGFRGIGKPATLSLAPGPGLTLVVGRNGSGKSTRARPAASRRRTAARGCRWPPRRGRLSLSRRRPGPGRLGSPRPG